MYPKFCTKSIVNVYKKRSCFWNRNLNITKQCNWKTITKNQFSITQHKKLELVPFCRNEFPLYKTNSTTTTAAAFSMSERVPPERRRLARQAPSATDLHSAVQSRRRWGRRRSAYRPLHRRQSSAGIRSLRSLMYRWMSQAHQLIDERGDALVRSPAQKPTQRRPSCTAPTALPCPYSSYLSPHPRLPLSLPSLLLRLSIIVPWKSRHDERNKATEYNTLIPKFIRTSAL